MEADKKINKNLHLQQKSLESLKGSAATPIRLHFSGVCVGGVFGLSVGKIKRELAWKCCSKQQGKANTAKSGNIMLSNVWTKKTKLRNGTAQTLPSEGTRN